MSGDEANTEHSASAASGRGEGEQPAELTGRARLRSAMVPRANRRQLFAGVLCAVLGFGAVTQVQSRDDESVLQTARQSDLIQILDAQSQLAERLEDELADLQESREDFLSDGDQQRVAIEQARERREVLGVLAGTLPARGPGISVAIADPGDMVTATRILGTIQELRNAGAEAIQVNDVRVVATTYFVDAEYGLVVDGTAISAPYRIDAIGDAGTLETAMGIPGGVVDTFATDGLRAAITAKSEVVVDSLQVADPPEYARPAADS